MEVAELDLMSQDNIRGQVEKIAASAQTPDPVEMTWHGVANLLIEQPSTARPLLAVLHPYLSNLDAHALWQLWRAAAHANLPEWQDALWEACGGKKDPTGTAVTTMQDTEMDQLCPDVYVHIHARLGKISELGAKQLSQSLAYRAIHHAFRGPWVGSGKLFETILVREDAQTFEFEMDGKSGNWFLALGKVLNGIVDKPYASNTAMVMEWRMAKQMEALLDTGLTTDHDEELACGRALIRGMDVRKQTFAPLLNAWILSGGDWPKLRELANPQTKEWIDRSEWVRRVRLTSLANRPQATQHEDDLPKM